MNLIRKGEQPDAKLKPISFAHNNRNVWNVRGWQLGDKVVSTLADMSCVQYSSKAAPSYVEVAFSLCVVYVDGCFFFYPYH